jgi:ribonuclease P protein subunit RPR2
MARGGRKEKNLGINPKNVQAFERLSFLHQAAILMSTIKYDTSQDNHSTATSKSNRDQWQGDPEGTLHATSRYLNSNMKQITGKLVMRL